MMVHEWNPTERYLDSVLRVCKRQKAMDKQRSDLNLTQGCLGKQCTNRNNVQGFWSISFGSIGKTRIRQGGLKLGGGG